MANALKTFGSDPFVGVHCTPYAVHRTLYTVRRTVYIVRMDIPIGKRLDALNVNSLRFNVPAYGVNVDA